MSFSKLPVIDEATKKERKCDFYLISDQGSMIMQESHGKERMAKLEGTIFPIMLKPMERE